MEKLMVALKDIEIEKGLDVACGVGSSIQLLATSLKNFKEIIGIDVHDTALAKAIEANQDERIQFQKASALHIPYDKNYFNFTSMMNSIHHIPEPNLVFEEMQRVTKAPGYIFFSEMIKDGQNQSQMSHVKFHHFAAWIDDLSDVYHRETYTEQELDSMISKTFGSNFQKARYVSPEVYKDEQEVKSLFEPFENRLNCFTDHPKFNEINEKWEGVKEYMISNGFQAATQLNYLIPLQ